MITNAAPSAWTTEDALASDGEAGLRLLATRSLGDRVADAIVEAIAQGELLPGARVPEVELATRLGVSRVPVREALKILGTQGIVETTLHRGSCIVPIDERRVRQIRDVRLALEQVAARDARLAFRTEPARLDRLHAVIRRMEERAARGDQSGVSTADLAFHRELVLASDNPIVLPLWEALARHVRIVFGWETQIPVDPLVIVADHQELCAGLAGDADLDALLARHILEGHPR